MSNTLSLSTKNLNYANYVITPITEAKKKSKKSELRQLRNYINYGGKFFWKKTWITPITSITDYGGNFFKEKSELRQLRNYTNYAVTKTPKPPTCLASGVFAFVQAYCVLLEEKLWAEAEAAFTDNQGHWHWTI